MSLLWYSAATKRVYYVGWLIGRPTAIRNGTAMAKDCQGVKSDLHGANEKRIEAMFQRP